MNFVTVILATLGLLVPASLPAATLTSATADAPEQILVKYKSAKAESNHPGKALGRVERLGVTVLQVPKGQKAKVLAALSRDPGVEYAEEDGMAQAQYAANDLNVNQWGLNNLAQSIVGQVGTADADVDAPEAWNVTQGNHTRVAVLDTGVDQNHPDISPKLVENENFTTAASVDDFYGHGTHVAGTIAAVTNNGQGVAGGCPDCDIMNVKVLRDDGAGYNSWIASGITWATDHGAKVINMSLGGSQRSVTLENAVNYAWSHGVVVVAAAGNSGSKAKLYPAAYTNAIAVAATDNRDRKASFSNYGSAWVDLAAPGVNIYATFPTHPFVLGSSRSMNYDFASGTSMATPMVAAAAALTWASPFGTSASSVRSRLELKADRITGTGNYWSAGRVNAARAVTAP